MRGRYASATWTYDGSFYATPRRRKSCRYDAFIPDGVAEFNDSIPAELAGVVAEAEAAVRSLNDQARPALKPLARLLLRTESIASSKVEGLHVDARGLARAEAQAEAGTAPVAAVATGRSKSAISLAMDQLVTAGVLVRVSTSQRNRAWEADGLLSLLAGLESGR